ncbi:MAG TPA: hypothetical protein ENJ50_00385, partial [Planctomycetaceae bacterium]|nr:hypothetical protein [Planctomycetaceae bacterium]
MKIAVVSAAADVPAWEAAMLAELADVQGVESELVVDEVTAAPDAEVAPAYRWYEQFDNRVFGMFDDPMAAVAVPASVMRMDALAEDQPCDLIVLLASRRDAAEVYLPFSRNGVLFYETVDNAGNPLRPAGYHEVMSGKRTSAVVVRHLVSPGNAGGVVYLSRSSTDAISPRRNREQIFW